MSDAQVNIKKQVYSSPPRWDVHFYDLGIGEVDAIRLALYRLARNEREAFNNGDPYGENISNVGLLAENLMEKMTEEWEQNG